MAATEYHIQNETHTLKELSFNALLPAFREKLCFFKTLVAPVPSVVEEMLLRRLLSCAGFGRRQEAAAIFKDYPDLLLRRGQLTDIAKKTYENISAFEYAVKAKDAQFDERFSNECLASVNRYIEASNVWRAAYPNRTYEENNRHFVQDVGESQADFEAHILQEYSLTGHSFHPWGKFDHDLPEKIRFYEQWDKIHPGSLPTASSSVPCKVLIYGGSSFVTLWSCIAREGLTGLGHLKYDCDVLVRLDKVRTENLLSLRERLMAIFVPDEDHERNLENKS